MKSTETINIIQANHTHLDLLVPLFDAYRVFYEQASDLKKAKEFLEERFLNKDSIIFLACNPEASAGYGFTQLYPSLTSVGAAKIIILNDLYVSPEFRRLSIARQLMSKAKDYAVEHGYSRINLQTAISNKTGQALYQSEGYQELENTFLSYSLDLSSAE